MSKNEGLLPRLANRVESVMWWYSRDVKYPRPPVDYPLILGKEQESTTCQHFEQYLKGCRITNFHNEGNMWGLDFRSPYSDEQIEGATAWVMGKFMNERNTIILHHSHGMYDPEKLAKWMFGKNPEDYNIVVVRAPYHTNPKRLNENGFDTMEHMEGVFAGSMLLIDAIVNDLRTRDTAKIGVVGVSMGGVVTTWQGVVGGNTADFYVPIVATPNAGEIFTGPGFRNLTDPAAINDRARYVGVFGYPDLPDTVKSRFFPVVALNDPIVTEQKYYWSHQVDEGNMLELPLGHLAPLFAKRTIRKHIEAATKAV